MKYVAYLQGFQKGGPGSKPVAEWVLCINLSCTVPKAYSLITQYPFFPGTGQPKKDNYACPFWGGMRRMA